MVALKIPADRRLTGIIGCIVVNFNLETGMHSDAISETVGRCSLVAGAQNPPQFHVRYGENRSVATGRIGTDTDLA